MPVWEEDPVACLQLCDHSMHTAQDRLSGWAELALTDLLISGQLHFQRALRFAELTDQRVALMLYRRTTLIGQPLIQLGSESAGVRQKYEARQS